MASSTKKKRYYKIVAVAGQPATGKTAFLQRYCTGTYTGDYQPTIGASFDVKLLELDDTILHIQLWDLNSLPRLRELSRMHFRGADGIILTYDMTDKDSLTELDDVLAGINDTGVNPVKIVVGLKCDMETKRQVKFTDALDFAVRHGMKLFETSALNGYHVEEVFECLGRELLALNSEIGYDSFDENISLFETDKQKFMKRQKKIQLPRKYKTIPTTNVLEELENLGLQTYTGFKEVMKYGTYRCFWCRIFLVGQQGVGKSTLAKVLVGEQLSDKQESTDGIWIYMGRAGISIGNRQWIYLPQGNSKIDTIAGMLLSLNYNVNFPKNPNVDNTIQEQPQTKTQSTDDAPNTSENVPSNQVTLMDTGDVTENDQLQPHETSQVVSDPEVSVVLKKARNYQTLLKETLSSNEILGKINMLVIDAIKEGKFKQKIVPFDIWDFGGQKEFYMTHQLFFTSRGVFVLMFNGSRDLKVNKELMTEPFYTNSSEAVYLLHWVSSVLTYSPKLTNGFPKIMLVATHKDRVAMSKRESQRKKLISSLEDLFSQHSGIAHLDFHDLLFIDARDPEDPEIEELRKRLINKAFEHPRWGDQMPTAWVPLELQIAEKVEKGINIISRVELSEMNEENKIMVLSEEQLDLFLKVQHSLGKLLYFDEVNLEKYIIINPVFLVDVLRSLVTEKQFWPTVFEYEKIHRSLNLSGTITMDNILLLWKQDKCSTFLEYKHYLLDILVHLDVLVVPQKYQAVNRADEIPQPLTNYNIGSVLDIPFYIVPCMVQKPNDTNYLKKKCLPLTSIIMSYRFDGEIIPPALGYRFLASFINMWDIKIYQGQRMLFSDLIVVQIDDDHDVAVQVKGKRVIVSLIHVSYAKDIVPTLASSIQQCLTAAIHRISEFYSGLMDIEDNKSYNAFIPFEIDFGVVCQSFFGFWKTICFFPHGDMPSTGEMVWTCPHGTEHNVRNLSLWFAEKVPMKQCQENCTGLGRLELEQCPLNRHIRRLVAEISPYKCRELAIHLGVTVNSWENLEYQFQHQNPDDIKFMALYGWKEAHKSASFSDLSKALTDCDISDHLLCKVFRDFELPEEYDTDKLSTLPSNTLLMYLSNHIGDSTFQLGIELELDVPILEGIRLHCKDKLLYQTRDILRQWTRNNPKATLGNLVKALYRIGKASSLKGLQL